MTPEQRQSITFALYAIEGVFPKAYEPDDLITLDDETLHKLAKPITGRKFRTLVQAYVALRREMREDKGHESA